MGRIRRICSAGQVMSHAENDRAICCDDTELVYCLQTLHYPLLSTATVTNPLGLTVVLNCSGIGNSICKKTFNNSTSMKHIQNYIKTYIRVSGVCHNQGITVLEGSKPSYSRHQAMGQSVWGLSTSRSKRFCSSPNCSDWLWGPPSLLFNQYQSSFPGLQLQCPCVT